jgi:hypothetical protein
MNNLGQLLIYLEQDMQATNRDDLGMGLANPGIRPLNPKTITEEFVENIAKRLGLDLRKVVMNELRLGVMEELGSMATYTTQSLTSEKLHKAVYAAYSKLMSTPNLYSGDEPNRDKNNDFAHVLTGQQLAPYHYNTKGFNEPIATVTQQEVLSLREVYFPVVINEGKKFFDFNEFKKIINWEDQQYYLAHRVPKEAYLGQGSSRETYMLSNNKVLKFAYNKFGLRQNQAELDVFTNPKTKDLVTRIFDYDTNFERPRWLVSELVKELTSDRDFEILTGIPFEEFNAVCWQQESLGRVLNRYKDNSFLKKIVSFITDVGIYASELTYIGHWGKTADGRLVVLDYGIAVEGGNEELRRRINNNGKQTVEESARLPKGLREAYGSFLLEKKFLDLQRFKNLQSAGDAVHFSKEEVQELYLKRHGTFLNSGSARRVYLVDNKSVLKWAKGARGLAQNETEVDVFTNPKTKPVVAKIYDYDPKFQWLVSEIVRPITDYNEFQKLTGLDFEQDVADLFYVTKFPDRLGGREEFAKHPRRIHNKFFQSILYLMEDTGLLNGDLRTIEHWGKTADGRVVLLDYGLSREVYQLHYNG